MGAVSAKAHAGSKNNESEHTDTLSVKSVHPSIGKRCAILEMPDDAIRTAFVYNGESAQCAEVVMQNSSDRRTFVYDEKPFQYGVDRPEYWNWIGQLVMQYGSSTYIGTATFLYHHDCIHKPFILTCAHNFYQTGLQPKYMDAGTFYLARDGKDRYEDKMSVTEFKIHPKYMQNPSIYSGYDIAIGLVDGHFDLHRLGCPHGRFGYARFLMGFETSATAQISSAHMPLDVCGYPKDGKGRIFDGELLGMQGHGKLTEAGNLIAYNDIDTSGGQSGSPVIHTAASCNRYGCQCGYTHAIVGVHVGGSVADGCNVATAITPDIYDWINSTLAEWGGCCTLDKMV